MRKERFILMATTYTLQDVLDSPSSWIQFYSVEQLKQNGNYEPEEGDQIIKVIIEVQKCEE